MAYKLFWTDEAINNLEEILDYLKRRWIQREINNFKNKLKKHLDLISRFPLMFPISDYNPRLRKSVVSKQTSVYFEIKNGMIYIAYIFVTRKNINKIKD